MESLIYKLFAGAILCSLVLRIANYCKSTAVATKFVTALFMILTLLGTVAEMDWGYFPKLIAEEGVRAEQYITEGRDASKEEMRAIISQQVDAYISTRAHSYGTDLHATITAFDDTTMKPVGISIYGSISPYIRKLLQHEIAGELGIPEENQIWN